VKQFVVTFMCVFVCLVVVFAGCVGWIKFCEWIIDMLLPEGLRFWGLIVLVPIPLTLVITIKLFEEVK